MASKAIDVVAKGLSDAAEDLRDLATIKDEISQLLVASKTRLLVVIDDIDRLTSTEVRQIFQLVKSVADFRNVTYLLAFDRDVVADSLSTVQEGTGNAYLEKIVNIPIEIPPIRQPQMYRLVVHRINSAIADDLPNYDWNNRRLGQGIFILSRAFDTLRQLDRFANVLTFSRGLIEGEVDYTDFTLLTALQILSPDLYYYVRNNPSVFVDTPETLFGADDAAAKKNQQAILDAIAGKRGQLPLEHAEDFLTLLFPKVEWKSGERRTSDSRTVQLRRERRICSDLPIFETYFQLAVPDEDVSKSALEALLNSLDEGTFKSALGVAIEEGRGIAFLERLMDYAEDERLVAHADVVLRVLLNDGDRFKSDIRGYPIRLDGPTLIAQFVRLIMQQLGSDKQRFEFLRKAIKGAHDSIRIPAMIVSIEDQAHGKYNLGGSGNEGRRSVSPDQLTQLEQLTLGKIQKWAQTERLGDIDELPYVLFRWKNWGSQSDVERFILEKLSDEQLIRFLGTFVGHPAVADPDNPDAVEWNTLKKLAPAERIRARVAKITDVTSPERQRIVAAIAAANAHAEIQDLVSD
jgi:predicted KAP-like P-loop ATPase